MPFVPVPRLVQVTLKCTQEGTARVSNFYYMCAAPHTWTPAELLVLATNWYNGVQAALKPTLHTGVNIDRVSAKDLSIIDGSYAEYVPAQPNPGTNSAGEALPASVAQVVSWRTGRSGRSYRGRTYLFGITEANTTGSFEAAGMISAQLLYCTYVNSFNNVGGITVVQVIYSREGAFGTPVSSFSISAETDSQRRRLPTRGN